MKIKDLVQIVPRFSKENYEVRIFLEKKVSCKPKLNNKDLTVSVTQEIKYLEVEKCVFSDLDNCFYIIPKKQEK